MALKLLYLARNEYFDTAKVYRDTEWKEYRVRFFHADELLDDADYFTTDKDDAINTAESVIATMAAKWAALSA